MNVFIKKNPRPGSASLICEARGLAELQSFADQHQLRLPQVLRSTQSELHLQMIHVSEPTSKDWQELGAGLARLHSMHASQFGFEEDNFIGLNPQVNGWHLNWGEFFTEKRLMYQVQLVADADLRDHLQSRFREWSAPLISFLNAHQPKPSLLHGDLWAGNVLFDQHGPWLIDPAVYYGDRETDLAMTEMFGGFSEEFYRSYEQTFPPIEGYGVRKNIYNLYHYLNHYNLFGSDYLAPVESGFRAIQSLL